MRKHQYQPLRLSSPPPREQGIVLVVFAIAALTLIGAGALTFDVAHTVLNKTRLQSAMDATALAGAIVLFDSEGDEAAATTAARAAFLRNAEAPGNKELQKFYDAGGTLEIQFSNTLHPFAVGTTPANYVRARITDMPLDIFLASAIGITEKNVSASAVAGPSPPLGVDALACNLAPMMVCGDPSNPEGTTFGYTYGKVQVLKTASRDASGDSWEVGTGNFQLVRFDEAGGAAARRALAGGYEGCGEPSGSIETEPGNTVGPVVQGLNTRLGKYLGPMSGSEDEYPPDVVVQQNTTAYTYDAEGEITTSAAELDFNFDDYKSRVSSEIYDYAPAPDGMGRYERRMLGLPIGDCSATIHGHGEVPLLGYGCFFLLQEVKQKGKEAHVYGQFVDGCRVSGRPGPTPGGGPTGGTEITIIQLYEDPDSVDS